MAGSSAESCSVNRQPYQGLCPQLQHHINHSNKTSSSSSLSSPHPHSETKRDSQFSACPCSRECQCHGLGPLLMLSKRYPTDAAGRRWLTQTSCCVGLTYSGNTCCSGKRTNPPTSAIGSSLGCWRKEGRSSPHPGYRVHQGCRERRLGCRRQCLGCHVGIQTLAQGCPACKSHAHTLRVSMRVGMKQEGTKSTRRATLSYIEREREQTCTRAHVHVCTNIQHTCVLHAQERPEYEAVRFTPTGIQAPARDIPACRKLADTLDAVPVPGASHRAAETVGANRHAAGRRREGCARSAPRVALVVALNSITDTQPTDFQFSDRIHRVLCH